MPLGQGIAGMWEAVRDRVEVSGQGQTWRVTAGSFDSALAYARDRFGDPIVLARTDRNRFWPRVTLTVTTDTALAPSAPALEDVARPGPPAQRTAGAHAATEPESGTLPSSLEAIFAHQEERRMVSQRAPEHDNREARNSRS